MTFALPVGGGDAAIARVGRSPAQFPEGRRRTETPGVDGALLWFGLVTGSIRGGTVVTGLDWRWTTLIPVFVGAAALTGVEACWAGLPMLGSPIGPALRLGAFMLVELRHRYRGRPASPFGRPTAGLITLGRYGGRTFFPSLCGRDVLGRSRAGAGTCPRAPPHRSHGRDTRGHDGWPSRFFASQNF
jgi:hypothetical protein